MKSVHVSCQFCGFSFKKEVSEINRTSGNFCSYDCMYKSRIGVPRVAVEVSCSNPECKNTMLRTPKEIARTKSGRSFCSSSCSAIVTNQERKRIRRSKIEAEFYERLVSLFPDLDILPNDKTMLGGLEVDIAIPSLKLAIEWNGIVHFKPIYGDDSFLKVQKKDAQKLIIASEKDINLVVISDPDSRKDTLDKAISDVEKIINSLILFGAT